MTPTIGEKLAQTRATLVQNSLDEASLEAELLLGLALGMERPELYASLRDDFPEACQQDLKRLVQRRVSREPTAYILGWREFFGLKFAVGPGVYIPRPETELLVEQAIAWVRGRFSRSQLTIADVGTGSGALAVSLAVHLATARIYATDVSPIALTVARTNAESHAVQGRVTFLLGDLLGPVPGPVDMVVANLPYVRSSEIPFLGPEISQFEPREALDGGADGLDSIHRLLTQATRFLSPRGAILLEMDPDQMGKAGSTALSVFPKARLRQFNDLAGQERVLLVDLKAP